jgi:4-amino-4-deoxy-L-arabinose transferase-like glycosyltransferase
MLVKSTDSLSNGARSNRLFWFAFAVIAIISAVSDLTKFSELPPQFIGHADQANTAIVARNIAEGKGAVVDSIWLLTSGGIPGNEIPIPEPYWSIYVAGIVGFFFLLFGSSLTTMLIPAVILKIAIASISSCIALRITKSVFAAFTVAVLLLFHPVMTRVITGLSDIYLTFFMLSAALVLTIAILRRSTWLFFLFGLITGIAIGVKPSGLLLLGLLFGYVLFYGQIKVSTIHFFIAIAGIIFGLLPLIIHNYQGFGSAISPASSLVKEAGRIRLLTFDHNVGFFNPEPFRAAKTATPLSTLYQVANYHFDGFLRGLKKGTLIPYFLAPFIALGVAKTLLSVRSLFIYRGAGFDKLFAYISIQMLIAGLILACAVHWEQRYWNFLIPFVTIISVLFIAELTMRKSIFASFYLIIIFGSLWAHAEQLRQFEPRPIPRVYEQAASILPRDAIVFTNDPWEFSFHTRLRSVMLPHTDKDSTLLSLSERYGVEYIVILHGKARHPKYQTFLEGELPSYLSRIKAEQWLTILKFK